jgi:hypothetical protein
MGLEAPRSLEAADELVFFCHASRVTLSGERPAKPHPRCSVGEPQASMALDMSSFVEALAGVAGRVGARDRA